MTTKWTIQRTAAPSVLPLTLADAKGHLRISVADTTHDQLIQRYIEAAVEQLEQDTGRVAIESSFTQYADDFESDITLHRAPVQSVASISYSDSEGVTKTLPTTTYGVDLSRDMVYLKSGQQWPGTNRERNNVAIAFVAGYGTSVANSPRLVQSALLLQVSAWFYDPAMESELRDPWSTAYERIIGRIMRSSYP